MKLKRITGEPQFAPWSEDPDPPDYWEQRDYEEMRGRLRAYWNGDDVGDSMNWAEYLHPRVEKGEGGAGRFGHTGIPKVWANARAIAALVHQKQAAAERDKPAKTKKEIKREDFEKAKIRFMGRGEGGDDAFLKRWNDKIGMDPEVFKKSFLGGVPASMDIYIEGKEFKVNGKLFDKPEEQGGKRIGDYSRFINPDDHSAYSSFFELNSSKQHSDIGKKVLAGNIATYEALGIDKVSVHANIDVGGYAWAKYGYVPTKDDWDDLSRRFARSLEGSSSGRRGGGDTYEAEEWDMLSGDAQEETERRWMRDTRSDFMESEWASWRDSGQPLNEAKKEIAADFNGGHNDWALSVLKETRKERQDAALRAGQEPPPDYPFNDEQILAALAMENYESKYDDGADDPEFTWNEKDLDAAGAIPGQLHMEGIEPPFYNKLLTDEMRDEIISALTDSFNSEADSKASDMEPPDYLGEQVEEYQSEFWSGLDDAEKLRHAVTYGQADIEIEPDEEEPTLLHALVSESRTPQMDVPQTETQRLLKLAESSDPKTLWEIADTKAGKDFLLGSSWHGTLDLKDPASYARFKKYVGRVKEEKRA